MKGMVVGLALLLAAGCAPEKCDWIAPHREVTESQRDIEALTLKAAYDHEMEVWGACHDKLTSSQSGIIEAEHHHRDIELKYERIIGPWLLETSFSPSEQRLVRDYKPTIGEALVPRARLLEKIRIWNRIKRARGVFLGRKVSFVEGNAPFVDDRYGEDKKLRIDRDLVWTAGNRDYAIAHSDYAHFIDDEAAGGEGGCTDSGRTCWFLGFLNGELVDSCEIGNHYWDYEKVSFYFQPFNNRLEIVSPAKGDDVLELFLSLWDYGDVSDGSRIHHFGTSSVEITDPNHDCKKASGFDHDACFKARYPDRKEW